jgi:hypothetical protein
MCEGRFLNSLKAKSGESLELYAPKLKAIAEQLRALPSAKQVEHLPIVPPTLVLSDELVATCKEV